MITRFARFLTRLDVQVAILCFHVAFGIFGIYNYFANYTLSTHLLVQQSQDREYVLERSGANSIEYFIKNIQQQLLILAKNESVSSIQVSAMEPILKNFVDNALSPVSGIARYNQSGKLIAIENRQRIKTGQNEDYSDYEFIQWSKDPENRSKIFISYPYVARAGASKGKIILVIATPCYNSNTYTGTLAVRFTLEEFQKTFLDPIITKEDSVFIVDGKGIVVTGNKALLNKNLFDYAKAQQWTGWQDFVKKFTLVIHSDEYKSSWSFKNPGQKTKEFLIASNRIDVTHAQRDLFLVVLIPADSINRSLDPLHWYGSFWLGASILFTISAGILFLSVQKLARGKIKQ